MPQDIKKYKVVRRGQKYCVRVKGIINTTATFNFCHDRKMSYHIRQPWITNRRKRMRGLRPDYWDYDFIFDKEYETAAFILGMLL